MLKEIISVYVIIISNIIMLSMGGVQNSELQCVKCCLAGSSDVGRDRREARTLDWNQNSAISF
jgi:hypothetical protein